MSPSRRVRAGICALLSTGLAMSSLGLRQVLADGTVPAPVGASAQVAVAASPGTSVGVAVSSGGTSARTNVATPTVATPTVAIPTVVVPTSVTSAAPATVQVTASASAATASPTASVSAEAALPAGVSASAGAASSGLPPASGGISTGVSAPAPVGNAIGTVAIGPGTPSGPSLANVQPSAMHLGSPGTALALDPTFGLTAGGAGAAGPTGLGAPQEAAAAPSAGVRAMGQSVPVICSQLVFRALVSGCQALLGPIGGGGLAATGTPLLTGLAGALLVLVGALIYWRSRRPSRTANGADGASRERRSARLDA